MPMQVVRVSNVSDALVMDCYYIANLFRPSTAMNIYNSMQHKVNTRGDVMFTCLQNNHVLGFVCGGKLDSGKWYIDWLFVDKLHQRRGVGRSLMDAYENYARDNGANAVLLHSAPGGGAPMFYKNRGYVLSGANYAMTKRLVR